MPLKNAWVFVVDAAAMTCCICHLLIGLEFVRRFDVFVDRFKLVCKTWWK